MKPTAARSIQSHTIAWLLMLLACCMVSCKKDSFITSKDAQITTLEEPLKFDTVFTTVGSVTQSFKINNSNNQKILLSSIKLMGGTSSAYKININGVPSAEVSNVELAANDSLYVFVSVKIDPNLDDLPFIVRDSILIAYNGNQKYVQLEAYGQNANFLRGSVIRGNVTWNNRLPYVILDKLTVDTTAQLTLEAGCRVYVHNNAPLLIDGSLQVNGTKAQPVLFTGDRLDTLYSNLPASWPGIYFRQTSQNNVLNFAQIRNAYQAVVAEGPSGSIFPKLTLHQCIIDNAYDAGLTCVNSNVQADNSLISNCGNNINIYYGGNYTFINCTVAAYSNYLVHKKPVLAASNAAVDRDGVTVTSPLTAVFTNCIFWGETGFVDNEIEVSQEGTATPVIFNNCIFRAAVDPATSTLNNCLKNQDPLFDSINVAKNIYDFHISNPQAPGIDKGLATGYPMDLDDRMRTVGLGPDIGCYEQQ